MPGTDLELLVKAAHAAGDVARQFSGPSAKVWEKPGGAGPVTEADLAVNRVLEDTLRSARPDYGWLSEESEDGGARLDRDRVFIVDPIDGTRSFMEGSQIWAHSLSVVERGKVIAGVIYLPMRDKLYAAALEGGATLNGTPLRVGARIEPDGATMLAAKPNFKGEFWRRGEHPGLVRNFRPSLAYRMALVAEGRFDAMMTLRSAWEWDIAAGALILQEAGAAVSDQSGAGLVFNNPEPKVPGVLAANPQLHETLTRSLVEGAVI